VDKLDYIMNSESFGDMDRYLARFIHDAAAGEKDTAAASAALVSAELTRGHICLNLDTMGGEPLDEQEGAPKMPDPDKWREALLKSGVAGNGSSFTPLILEENRLYLQRYWRYEGDIAESLTVGGKEKPRALSPEENELLKVLFPGSENDLQRSAAAMALTGGLAVITGGPGTGKTTALARFLYILLNTEPDVRVALGAPTGKAAARMNEAIAAAREQIEDILPTDKKNNNHKSIMEEMGSLKGRTLHRLLGYRPGGGFRHDRENPLLHDVVVIDEASMIDCSLMAKLCRALRPGARLILLGDRDQLASVEAGAILADICESAGDKKSPLTGHVVELKESWRFRHRPGIGALAEAVNRGESAPGIMKIFETHDLDSGINIISYDGSNMSGLLDERLTAAFKKVAAAPDPESALSALGDFRILSPLRRGPGGVEALNRLAEKILFNAGVIHGTGALYENRPVMVTRNSYNLGLFNGDTGIMRSDAEGKMRVYFPAVDGEGVRSVLPAMMPPHETVYAMTVHKAQGSEFTHLLFVLPGADAPVITRELLYTAITRGRDLVEVALTSPHTLEKALERRVERASGLAFKLV